VINGFWIALSGVGVAAFFAGIGSSVGVGIASRTAAGLLSEQPEKFGKVFLLVILPSTQGIYGFVIGMFLLWKLGVFGGGANLDMTLVEGLRYVMMAVPVGGLGAISGIHQGLVCSSGIELAAKQPEATMRAVIFAAMVETYAILGFILSLLPLLLLG
jgi:V/A-type H+-transporting ATPase subunit K